MINQFYSIPDLVSDGRRTNGGYRAGAGTPTKVERAGLERLLDECFSETERRQVIKKQVADSLSEVFKERHEARKLLFAYVWGKPREQEDSFEFTLADLQQLSDYEIDSILAGDDPRTVFAASRRRLAQASAARESKRHPARLS